MGNSKIKKHITHSVQEKARLKEKRKEVEQKNQTLAEINRSKAAVSTQFVRTLKKAEKEKKRGQK